MEWLSSFLRLAWSITTESAPWVVLSLLIGGLVHEFLPASRFSALLNRRGGRAMVGAVAFGAMLPICSCGVIPLAVSLYRSGVRIGPVIAFAAATPIINPAAVIVSLALLGPELTIAYVLFGLSLPFALGLLAERWAAAPTVSTLSPAPMSSDLLAGDPGMAARLLRGLRWGVTGLGPSIAFYLAAGVLVAAAIMATLPSGWIDTYLGGGDAAGLLMVGAFGAVIYVCAVAHIPVVATLLAAGASPGAAIVFLVTGAATNLPELVALYHAIGRRTVIVYTLGLVAGSLLAGLIVNAILLPGFEPAIDPLRSLDYMRLGQLLQPTASGWMAAGSALLLMGLAAWGLGVRLKTRLQIAAPIGPADQTHCPSASCCPSNVAAKPETQATVPDRAAG